ncbi:MAG: hypothetical protein NDI94_05470 [Candidatus Woesearchaeota archaeon]|nr:hypothetical protein [Candidatus Woesearchaeota archaeon]
MDTKKILWLIFLLISLPYILFALTILDSILHYFSGGNEIFFSYPIFGLFQAIYFLLGSPDGFAIFGIIIGSFLIYSGLTLAYSIFMAIKLNKLENSKKNFLVILFAALIILSPAAIIAISSGISNASHDKRNSDLLLAHKNLTIALDPAEYFEDDVIIPVTIRGLREGYNENNYGGYDYNIEFQLYDKNNKNKGSLGYEIIFVNHTSQGWSYGDAKTIDGKIMLNFSIYDHITRPDEFELLVTITKYTNRFYEKRIAVE